MNEKGKMARPKIKGYDSYVRYSSDFSVFSSNRDSCSYLVVLPDQGLKLRSPKSNS